MNRKSLGSDKVFDVVVMAVTGVIAFLFLLPLINVLASSFSSADEIVADLSERGGSLRFSYNLDINSSLFSKNTVNITVREA